MHARTLFSPLILLLLLSGCRLYGGYDAKDLRIQELTFANERFAEELQQVQQDLQMIEARAATDSSAADFATRLRVTALLHETYLNQHRAVAAALAEDPPGYRPARRAMGAVVSEQQLVRRQYASLFTEAGGSGDYAADAMEGAGASDGRYWIAPPYYARLIASTRFMATVEEREEGERWPIDFGGTLPADTLAAPADTAAAPVATGPAGAFE